MRTGHARLDRPFLVSIRTRPFGRVMPWYLPKRAIAQLVSIRTRPFGRVMRAAKVSTVTVSKVSIRTRPFGRVMHGRIGDPLERFVFQSAPGLSAG